MRWEYRKENEQDCNIDEMNKLGQEGWEMVGLAIWAGIDYYIFKRQIHGE